MSLSLIGVSLPTFLIGIGLIYLFAVELRWLPSFGRGDVVQLGWWSTGLLTETGRKSLIMPALTLGFFQLTLIMRLVRAEMLEALRTDYIKFARARGIPERSISFRHALRNTMIPVITIAGLQFGSVIAFAIVTETVFQWPGLGALFVQAVQFVDIPVMAAYLMFVALVFVVVNLAVDLLYFARRSAPARLDRGGADSDARPDRSRAATLPDAALARVGLRRRLELPPLAGRDLARAIVADPAVLGRARWRRWIAPQNPFDAAHAQPDGRLHQAGRAERRSPAACSCSAPTTRAATCSRRSSTARACRCWSASPRWCSRSRSASRSAWSPAISAAAPTRSSCASPTSSSRFRRS